MEVKRNEEEIVDRMMECGEILRVLRNKLKSLEERVDLAHAAHEPDLEEIDMITEELEAVGERNTKMIGYMECMAWFCGISDKEIMEIERNVDDNMQEEE